MIAEELLATLRCPKTQQPLQVASEEELASINQGDRKWQSALVTKDGAFAYPIDEGFPILLIERMIEVSS